MDKQINDLINSDKIYSRNQVLENKNLVPSRPGVYALFFKEIPSGVPTENCKTNQGLTLLYVGISPTKPPKNGKPPSRQDLRKRIRYHYRGNAEGSTLRLTLGCLLSNKLGIQLRRVGSGNRMTFTKRGEEKLSTWMLKNAFVSWVEHDRPWELEEVAIKELSLPLNLRDNDNHIFASTLSRLRSEMKKMAKELPIISY